MAQSKHVGIRAAVAALFRVVPALASGNVFENRDFKLATGVLAQVNVNFANTDPAEDLMGLTSPIDWTTDIEVVVLARKDITAGTEASDVADAIWVDAYARVMADRQLGGLVDNLTPGAVDSEPDEADSSLCRLTARFTAIHRTDSNSIS